MKLICASLVLFFVSSAQAVNQNYSCLLKTYLDYTSAAKDYWELRDSEFKKLHPELQKGFYYLNQEQVNYIRMKEITIDYVIKFHPTELKLSDGNSLYNLVPRYTQYQQEIYRELRKIPEFNQLYKDNESYKHNNMMPDYERLKMASTVLKEIDNISLVDEAMSKATSKSQTPISSLACGS